MSGLKTVYDGMAKFHKDIEIFKAKNVLIGVPEQATTRKDGEPIGNAGIAYVQNFGSPVRNIPAREFAQSGIKKVGNKIIDALRIGARDVFKNGGDALLASYTKAGIIGANGMKAQIVSQEGFKELSEATLEARERKGFAGTKALIRTGQLLNSLTFVIRNKR